MDEEKDLAQRKKKPLSGQNSWRANGSRLGRQMNRPSQPPKRAV
ncbi:hypothetical protein GA8_00900 [Geobacillus sp. A8]|nr:hypothetical protein GA8_00900 [Geobacillus sp. A8]